MSEEITLNYTKIEWTYDRANGSDSETFKFNFQSAGKSGPQEDFDPGFSAGGSSEETEIAIEEMTIAHEHIERPHDTDVPFFDDFFA